MTSVVPVGCDLAAFAFLLGIEISVCNRRPEFVGRVDVVLRFPLPDVGLDRRDSLYEFVRIVVLDQFAQLPKVLREFVRSVLCRSTGINAFEFVRFDETVEVFSRRVSDTSASSAIHPAVFGSEVVSATARTRAAPSLWSAHFVMPFSWATHRNRVPLRSIVCYPA